MDLNKFGKRAFLSAQKRGKISECGRKEMHQQSVDSLSSEILEVEKASEMEFSEHLPQYTEIVEELADVAIVAITELYRRGIDIEKILHEKMKFNETRS